jgi:hypothetical protein
MGTLLQDVRYGLRMLVKKPTFTIARSWRLYAGASAAARGCDCRQLHSRLAGDEGGSDCGVAGGLKQRNHFKGCRKKRLTTALALSSVREAETGHVSGETEQRGPSAVHNVM